MDRVAALFRLRWSEVHPSRRRTSQEERTAPGAVRSSRSPTPTGARARFCCAAIYPSGPPLQCAPASRWLCAVWTKLAFFRRVTWVRSVPVASPEGTGQADGDLTYDWGVERFLSGVAHSGELANVGNSRWWKQAVSRKGNHRSNRRKKAVRRLAAARDKAARKRLGAPANRPTGQALCLRCNGSTHAQEHDPQCRGWTLQPANSSPASAVPGAGMRNTEIRPRRASCVALGFGNGIWYGT